MKKCFLSTLFQKGKQKYCCKAEFSLNKLGRKVKNFDEKAWSEVSFDMMFEAVYAKFSQNEDLKALLLSEEYEGKSFVEGSPYDAIWGVKMYWNDPKIGDESNWKGENKLGKVLDKVREEIKKPSYE